MAAKGAETTVQSVDGENASLIDWSERDHSLKLHESDWGAALRPQWREVTDPGRHFTRPLLVSDASETKAPDIQIEESIVRFPSVPIYGINRKANYNLEFSEKPNMHTLRLLMRPAEDNCGPVTRTFILHNGLNETSNLHFYYRLASWILREDKDCEHNSACIIAPFPGHLMHAPFSGPFGQTPLARYLADSGDLFRQFLRYMIEMRWLLSMIIRDRPESWRIGGSTLKLEGQADLIQKEMVNLRNASRKVWEGRRPFEGSLGEERDRERKLLGAEVSASTVQSSIDVMTHLLGPKGPGEKDAMPVHVVGYSLGGFLAQSVFFAWPNIVSSCSTICSGGAIRALSPTAFAHAEEWQAVLHSLRPELENSLIGRRIVRDNRRIVGMGEAQFGYYQRIFDQVFLQEDNASYKARLSEYGTRMLFVSGGEDPIVKTKEVLDAGPADGITMLSVANLTHFLGEDARSARETEQREFWLPEAGGLVARAARRAEVLQQHELEDAGREHDLAVSSSLR